MVSRKMFASTCRHGRAAVELWLRGRRRGRGGGDVEVLAHLLLLPHAETREETLPGGAKRTKCVAK